MIFWNDFVLDDATGPLLSVEFDAEMLIKVCRNRKPGCPSVTEDAGQCSENTSYIQETRQEQRPARMVGLSSLDLAQASKDAGRSVQVRGQRLRGKV